jgi:hypothetical protein
MEPVAAVAEGEEAAGKGSPLPLFVVVLAPRMARCMWVSWCSRWWWRCCCWVRLARLVPLQPSRVYRAASSASAALRLALLGAATRGLRRGEADWEPLWFRRGACMQAREKGACMHASCKWSPGLAGARFCMRASSPMRLWTRAGAGLLLQDGA